MHSNIKNSDSVNNEKNSLPTLGYKARVNVTGIIDVFPTFKKPKKVVKYSELKNRSNDLEGRNEYLEREIKRLENSLVSATFKQSGLIQHQIDVYNEELIENSAEYYRLKGELDSLGSELGYKHDKKKASEGYVLNGRSARKIKFQINWLFRKVRDIEHQTRARHGGKIPKHIREKLPKLLWYTFTVPDKIERSKYLPKIDDMPISKQFSRFMETLREYHGVNHYVIVAERQSGKKLTEIDKQIGKQPTNKIHFHAIILQESDIKLNIRGVNALWLWHLNKLNYQTFSKSKIKQNESKIQAILPASIRAGIRNNTFLREIFNPYDYFNTSTTDRTEGFKKRVKLIDSLMFNPVDCAPIRNIKQLQAYMTKYVTKGVYKSDNDDKNKDIDGNSIDDYKIYCRVYRSSKKIGGLQFFREITSDYGLINSLSSMVEKVTKGAKKGMKKIYETALNIIDGEPPFIVYHYKISERKRWLKMFYSLRRAYFEIVRNQYISNQSLINKTSGLCI